MPLDALVGPFLPLVAAAVISLVVATIVRRDYLLVAATTAAGIAAMCVVAIGIPLMEHFDKPRPGAGGPWGFGGSSENLIFILALIYGVMGALLGLLIAAFVFAFRSPRS